MEIKLVKAKKEYKCNRTGRTIKVGEKYQRVNVNYVGIFHFKLGVPEQYIRNTIDNAIIKTRFYMDDIPLPAGGENGEW